MAGKRDKYKALLDKVQNMDLGTGGFWKPPVGRSVIRVLPPVGEMEFFFQEVGRHYKQNQYCPAFTTDGEEKCPICEINEELFQAGEKDAAANFRVSRAFWMNVIVRSQEDSGPQIFTPGVKIFNALVTLISDPDYGDITDIEDGFDIKLDRTGEGMNTEYQVNAVRNPSPLGSDEQIEDWLEIAEDLHERIVGQLKTYDEMVESAGLQPYLDGDYDDIEEDEDDEEPPPRRRSSRRSRRSSKR